MAKYLHKEWYFRKYSKLIFQTNTQLKYAVMWFDLVYGYLMNVLFFRLITDAKLCLNVIIDNLYLSGLQQSDMSYKNILEIIYQCIR